MREAPSLVFSIQRIRAALPQRSGARDGTFQLTNWTAPGRHRIFADTQSPKKGTTMPRYVDGFVIPIRKSKLAAYRAMAAKCGKIWKEHGALEFIESVGDDLKIKGMVMSFPKMAATKSGETVLFSFIIYKSRKQRDAVNKKVMADPRLKAMMGPKDQPFDFKRMAYGGFKVIVDQ
jgi:uncharacterized protein YbaA (DUF1428 family)